MKRCPASQADPQVSSQADPQVSLKVHETYAWTDCNIGTRIGHGCFFKSGVLVVGVLIIRALLFWV